MFNFSSLVKQKLTLNVCQCLKLELVKLFIYKWFSQDNLQTYDDLIQL